MKRFLIRLLFICQVIFIEANYYNEQEQCLGDVCDGNLLVRIENGVLRGKDNDYYYSYESIPYAEAPVGELRFESPLKFRQKWVGILDATKPAPKCMQYDQFATGEDKVTGVEDCLTLSIYRPKFVNELLPVLVVIHGGAFMFGSGTSIDHRSFMKSGRVLVVTMSYRLGPLGFVSTEDDVVSGNFGLKDQKLALKWIEENISQFGGDSNRIMLLGFSAGGASTHLHMLRPDSKETIQVAASFSGTALNPWVVIQKAKEKAFKLGKHLGCSPMTTSAELKECFKRKDAKEIVDAVKYFLVFGYNPFTTFGPVIENLTVNDAFLNKAPEDIILSQEYSPIPWMASYTKEDGVYVAAELLQKTPEGKELIEVLNENWEHLAPYALFFKDRLPSEDAVQEFAKNIKATYLGGRSISTENYKYVQKMYTDLLFKNDIERAVRLHSQSGKSPVYSYIYDNPADKGVGFVLSNRTDIDFGTGHGDDFFLIFYNSVRNEIFREDEKIIADNFITMLEDFIYTNGKLSFGSCDFVDNTGKDQLQLMFIGKYSCENKAVESFP